MWLFSFDSARFCSIEVVPVIIHQLCVSICFYHVARVLSHFSSLLLFWGKDVSQAVFYYIFFLIWRPLYFFWYVWDLSIFIFCDMSDHIPCHFFLLYPFLLDFSMTWIAVIFFPSLSFLFWLSGDIFSEQKY